MPWQAAPGLLVIGTMFTITGLMLPTIDTLFDGRPRRTQIDEYIHSLDNRDRHLRPISVDNVNYFTREVSAYRFAKKVDLRCIR